MEGIAAGKRDDLIRGGLIRNSRGWQALKEMRMEGVHVKGDERILGDSDFVESVFREQDERFNCRHRLKAHGYDLGMAVARGAELFNITKTEILQPNKKPDTAFRR
jgi:putative transposase